MYSSFSKYFAEMIGTLILVLVGAGSAVLAGNEIGVLGVALAFGLTLMALTYALGPVSGAHINPAVTIGLALRKRFDSKLIVPYVFFQLVGGIIGGYILYIIASGHTGFIANAFAANGFAEHSPNHYSLLACGIAEATLTGLLVFVTLSTISSGFAKGFGGIAIGVTFVIIYLLSIPVTNGSSNFARTLGVAAFADKWALQQLGLFAVTSVIGAIIGAFTHYLIYSNEK
jgi:aquaporin Z